MSTDVELYEKSTDHYDQLQNLRPDYMNAKKALFDLALKHLADKIDITIADFCCGTGINTKMLAGRLPVSKAVLVDINDKFLEIAQHSGINAQLEIVPSDILKVDFHANADAVISMFAYHHVPDEMKADYISQVRDALKDGGLLFLGEIYSPNKKTTLDYYNHLYEVIPKKLAELHEFLMQTAQSDHFEYKVAKKFADAQLQSAGFKVVESKKIWPDGYFDDADIGTFVEVWKRQ